MKCSLEISHFLERISILSHFIVFLYFFALITEEGFLLSPCYFFLKDRTLKDELTSSVGGQYATGDQWRSISRKNEEMEPKQKQHPVVDVTGDGSKVPCCKEPYCLGTWRIRSTNQGKLITKEGFIISPCYSLELCILMDISFLFSFALASLIFKAICKAPQTTILLFCIFFSLGWSLSLPPVQCHVSTSIVLWALHLLDLISWNYLSLLLYNHKGFDIGHTWMV